MMGSKQWPQELHNIARTLWREGLHWKQLESQTGVPRATLQAWQRHERWDSDDAEQQTAEDILRTIRLSVSLMAIHLRSRLTRPDALADFTAPEIVLSLQRLLSAMKDAADVLPLVDVAGFDVQLQSLAAMLPELGLSEEQQANMQATIDLAIRTRLDSIDADKT